MNYMYTISTKKDLGKLKRLILKLIGISFVNHYKSNISSDNEKSKNSTNIQHIGVFDNRH